MRSFSKETGYCHGRGGSMHIADVTKGNLGANGIVGQAAHRVGAAFTIRRDKTSQAGRLLLLRCSDQPGNFSRSGQHVEGVHLPILRVCENNLYGLSTPIEKVSATATLADRAKGYNMTGVTVNGMDVEAVRGAAEEAVKRGRSGGGPTFIEVKTYRYFGHGASDHRPYRTREEEQEWWKLDPVASYGSRLVAEGAATKDELAQVESEIIQEVETGLAFALASPDPKAEESTLDVDTEN